MRTIVSAAVSLDGYLDDCSPRRLKLSSAEDWSEVAAMRSRCDAILVGAGTVRTDNPSLIVKDEALRQLRILAGMEPDICKVTITRSGNIPAECDFFTRGGGRKIVFTTPQASPARVEAFMSLGDVFIEDEVTPAVIAARLSGYGYRTLFVEGGTSVLGMYLGSGTADLLRLAVAPFFVGEREAPRFVPPGSYSWDKDSRMVLRSTANVGGTAVINMVPQGTDEADRELLARAVTAADRCTPSSTAYCVGAVVVSSSGEVFEGYTHETDPSNHAEEEAISKALAVGCDLRGASIYSSMEPCTHRKSKPQSCSDLIIRTGFSKVVYALPEPAALAPCEGHNRLVAAGLEVVRMEGFDRRVIATNSHILSR